MPKSGRVSGVWNDPLGGRRNRLFARDSGPCDELYIDAEDGHLRLSEPGSC